MAARSPERSPGFTASGRTDAGVHALGQVVRRGDRDCELTPENRLQQGAQRTCFRMTSIVVPKSARRRSRFHATHDALRKTYRYQIHNSRVRPLFDRRYVWFYPTAELDVQSMRSGAAKLVGRHDFASLETTGSERATTVRTILDLSVTRSGDRIDILVTGDGFLYNMVRAIAGTLVEVGRGAQRPEWVAEVIAARDRAAAGPNAPALGLALASVEY